MRAAATSAAAEVSRCRLSGPQRIVRVVGVLLIGRHWLAQKSLDGSQIRSLLGATERDCGTAGTRSGGAPDPMHVGLRLDRKVIVDDVGNVIDIQAARRKRRWRPVPGSAPA